MKCLFNEVTVERRPPTKLKKKKKKAVQVFCDLILYKLHA